MNISAVEANNIQALYTERDRELMQYALRLAEKGMNSTSPNPRVGCVIADDEGRILAEGWHQRAGDAHAEVAAITNAKSRCASLMGKHVYVTLEPCSHSGRTPPCAEALIDAGVASVFYAMEDPNPTVSGRGLAKLKQAGIDVRGPVMEAAARELNKGFVKRMEHGQPYIRIKSAISLDGRTAMASGESKWITAPAAREDVQQLRARSCALITGVGSVEHDDPSLTVRLGDDDRQPLRVIVDTHLRCPLAAQMFTKKGETVIACSDQLELPNDDGRRFWPLPEREGRVSLPALVRKLADEGCNEVLVETGAVLAGAFVREALVDEFVIYLAPKFLGSRARPLFDLPISTMSGNLPLIIDDICAVGHDWRIRARPDPDS